MNAESTVLRSSRPAVVVAPGGEGARVAAWLLAWPMRLAATPMGRRLLAAVALAVVAVGAVGYLYDSADQPRVPAIFRPAGLAADAGSTNAAAVSRSAAASPVRAKRAATPAEAAAAWWAARQKVAVDKVRSLQQRKVSATEVQVLVVAEGAGSRMPSDYVTVRKGSSGWKVP
jgi:hypothetical protein